MDVRAERTGAFRLTWVPGVVLVRQPVHQNVHAHVVFLSGLPSSPASSSPKGHHEEGNIDRNLINEQTFLINCNEFLKN